MNPGVRYLLRWPSVRWALSLFAVSLAAVSVSLLLWLPLHDRVEADLSRISELKSSIARNAANGRLLSSFLAARRETELFRSGLMKEGESSAAMSAVSTLAERCDIKIVSGSLARGRTEEGFDLYSYDLAMHGGYRNLRLFLAGLEEIQVRFEVRELEIRKNGPDIEARLRLEAYQAAKRADGNS